MLLIECTTASPSRHQVVASSPPEPCTKRNISEMVVRGTRDHPVQSQIPRGFSHMKFSELQQACVDKGIVYSTADTRGQLISKLRVRETEEAAQNPCMAKGSDTICFGKHVDQTYAEVLSSDRSYCTWVQMTAEQEPHCAAPLRRFADWLRHQVGDVPLPTPTRVQPTPMRGAASSANVTPAERAAEPARTSGRSGGHSRTQDATPTTSGGSSRQACQDVWEEELPEETDAGEC